MTDARDKDSTQVFGEFTELEIPPMVGYIVHQVASAPTGQMVWAWCEIVQGLPGYRSVTFTRPDGVTTVDPHPQDSSKPLVLASPPLFQVWC